MKDIADENKCESEIELCDNNMLKNFHQTKQTEMPG